MQENDQQFFRSDELPSGFRIANRYEVTAHIGSGGMGSVYLAHDRLLDSAVAIKILHREFMRDPGLMKRFLREVKLMHTVNHPNVVRTFDVSMDSNMLYFTMEYIQGLVLDEYLACVGNHLSVFAPLVLQICHGLEAIHQVKIVHRDLKPANIIVSNDGCVKITDFGVARPESSSMTAHQEIMGSLDYLSPEILRGDEITASVDFYSLGIILYEVTTGMVPFEADDLATLMYMHVNKAPLPPKAVRSDIPDWLNDLILSLMEKSPGNRPRTAADIVSRIPPRLAESVACAGDRVDRSESHSCLDVEPIECEKDQFGSNVQQSAPASTNTGPFLASSECAYQQVIFDALPTTEEIREHEERIAKDRMRRAELQSKEAVEGEKN